MSDLFARIAIEDAAVEPLGVKEAMAMALEHLGGVRVLEIQLREPEQTSMAGVVKHPPRSTAVPTSANTPAAPRAGGQAPARSSRRPQTAMECCFTCARYHSDRNQDAGGDPYWGICGRTGQPVYDLKDRCGAWARLGG